MIWILVGGIPLAILLLLAIGFILSDEDLMMATLFGVSVTAVISGGVFSVIYGLHELGVIAG